MDSTTVAGHSAGQLSASQPLFKAPPLAQITRRQEQPRSPAQPRDGQQQQKEEQEQKVHSSSQVPSQAQGPQQQAAFAYKQLIFGYEAEGHTHWDEARGSALRMEMMQTIFTVLQRGFRSQKSPIGPAAVRKVAHCAASVELQVYRLHAIPQTYAQLLSSRRSLRETLVHVYQVQDKVDFLRRLLKRFSHYMQCPGCSRRGCREFRQLGDHALECLSVRALLTSGDRVPCRHKHHVHHLSLIHI